jgi:16S rRNA (adenine1518-N6/adenine1519-N6)-dimethyltransferase
VVAEAGIQPDDEVLEIGPGPGTLTDQIAGRARRLVAVELDPRLAARLRRRFAGRAEVEVVEGDILRTDLAELFPSGGEIVVGNIPYYLTGALLPRLLDQAPRPKRISLVVQREVAERWTAPAGASTATVAVQLYTEARLALHLPAAAFDPAPQVDSALVVMEVRAQPALELDDPRAFFALVERVFQFRRKQLAGSLPRVTGLPAAEVAARLQGLGIDPRRRPETLLIAEWGAVYRRFRE